MNKKKWVVWAVFCLFFSDLQAQNTSLGLRLGANFANMSGEQLEDNGMKFGLNFGALLTYSVSPEFGISGEVNYSSKGSKNKTSDIALNLNYLEIPVYANYFLGKTEATFRPKLMLGGYFGYLMSARVEGVEVNGYNTGDFGVLLGAGGHYRLGGGNWLNMDLRYTLGLANVANVPNNMAVKNGVFSLNFAWTFPLGNYEL